MAIRVMLVDDDSSARFLIRTILDDQPGAFEVVGETALASEAVDLLRRTAPDVVLLDAVMPIVDGYELAARLLDARADARLVLLSAHVDERVRERAAAAGIRACVEKGDLDGLPRAIRAAAAAEPGASAARG